MACSLFLNGRIWAETQVHLTASDGGGTSSFNSAGNWSPSGAPTAGDAYTVTGVTLRTPTGNFSDTFGGDSLTIGSGGRILGKEGTATITFLNAAGSPGGLILDGGFVDSANGGTSVLTIAGLITVDTISSGGVGAGSNASGLGANNSGETLIITANIAGSGNLQIGGSTFNSGNDSNEVEFSSGAGNTYSGTITVGGGGKPGTLEAGTSTAFTSSMSVVLSNTTNASTSGITSSTFNLNGNNVTLGSLSGGGGGATTGGNAVLGANALTLYPASADAFAGIISGSGGSLVMAGTSTLTLSGANTYTGGTTLQAGVLNAGSSTALGTGSVTFTGGTLQYSSTTVDYSTKFASSTGAISIDTNGNNPTLAGIIASSNTGGLTKLGSGTLTLSGADAYTGATTVSAGTLAVSTTGSTAAGSAVSVSSTLNVTGTVGGTVAVNSGGILTGTGSNTGTGYIGGLTTVNGGGAITLTGANPAQILTVNGLTLGGSGSYGAGQYATLNYTLTSSGAELIDVGTSATTSNGTLTLNSGGAYIDLTGTPVVNSTTVLMNYNTSELAPTGFSLSPTTAGVTTEATGFDTYTLNDSGGVLSITYAGNAPLTLAYFTGKVSNTWNDASGAPSSNWSSNLAGTTDSNNFPSSITDVVFSANTNGTSSIIGNAINTSLGVSTIINSFNVNTNPASVTIGTTGDGYVLTLNATNTDSAPGAPTGATGVYIASGAGAAVTINDAIVLGSSQTWYNGSSSALTLNNGISGGFGLTISNSGAPTIFNAATTYTGTTTISAGALQLGNANAVQDSTVSVGVNNGLTFTGSIGTFTLGGLSGSGNVSLEDLSSNAVTLQIGSDNASTTYSGNLTDTGNGGALTKQGTGTLVLTGANNYTGATIISAGTLQIGNGGTASISASSAISGSGTLAFDVSANIAQGTDFSGNALAGGLSLTQAGTGTLSLTAANTYGGNTTISAGTLAVTGTGSLGGGTYAGAIIDNGTLNYGSSVNQTLSGAISGTGNLTMSGTGTLTISNGADTYGNLNILNGTLQDKATVVAVSTELGSGTITLGQTGQANTVTLLYDGTQQGTYSNAISVNGTGTNTIEATNWSSAYNGAVTLNGGATLTLLVANNQGSNLVFNGGITGTGNLALQVNSNNGGTYVRIGTGGINNTGTITNNGTGGGLSASLNGGGQITGVIGTNVTGVIQNSADSNLTLSGANTYISDTTVTLGTLILSEASGASSTAAQDSVVNLNGGALAFGANTTSATLGGLAGSGNLNLVNTAGTPAAVNLTIGNSNVSYAGNTLNPTYSGVLSNSAGTASLTMVGTDTQTLTGTNTYNGGTTVSGGTLYVNNSGGSSIPANPGETVTANNPTSSGTGSGSVTVAGSGPSAIATLAGSGTIVPGTGGVIINQYGSLSSGGVQTATPGPGAAVTGTGITLVNTGGTLTSLLSVNNANLTFALGTNTTLGTGVNSFNNPSTNSTYISVQGDNGNGSTTGEINFSGSDSVTLVDVTATLTGPPTATLALRQATPYLLIAAGTDNDYYGLLTSATDSTGDATLDGNGYVLGVYTGIGSPGNYTNASYTAITINQENMNLAQLTAPQAYAASQLYLFNGDLEVVPEPGTWALMLGGLAVLIFIQRRRRSNN